MKTPREIYAQYTIMPSLQTHQLRVAAVAKMICDNSVREIDVRVVLLECLFHDMGNIIKSDLDYFPDFVQPEGKEYWETVKADFVQRYGVEQHAANAAIAREIGLPEQVIEIMNTSGFSLMKDIAATESLELKVCQYADMRVGPHGVLPMKERMLEGRDRYKKREVPVGGASRSEAEFEELMRAAKALEEQIFSDVGIKPEDITDAAVEPVIAELWEYPVS